LRCFYEYLRIFDMVDEAGFIFRAMVDEGRLIFLLRGCAKRLQTLAECEVFYFAERASFLDEQGVTLHRCSYAPFWEALHSYIVL
jgi:hypothetical protein